MTNYPLPLARSIFKTYSFGRTTLFALAAWVCIYRYIPPRGADNLTSTAIFHLIGLSGRLDASNWLLIA